MIEQGDIATKRVGGKCSLQILDLLHRDARPGLRRTLPRTRAAPAVAATRSAVPCFGMLWLAAEPDQARPSTRTAFDPPNANEFDAALRIGAWRATLGTKSRSHSGSASSKLAVGGIVW